MSTRAETLVLVVDDEVPVAMLAVGFLKKLGFTTARFANNETDALRMIQQADPPFELLITDKNPPQHDAGLLIIAKAKEKNTAMKTILISGNFGDTPHENLRVADELLSKPFTLTELEAALEKLFTD